MKERNRLDEIVEEEIHHKTGYWCKPDVEIIGRNIAERAFRHGVEQEMLRHQNRGLMNAEPAPAEEKCPRCGGHPHEYPPSLDRRKGQRLKGLEALYSTVGGPPCYSFSVFTESGVHSKSGHDRRSGKDRRRQRPLPVPPAIPRFEHTGEFRRPQNKEWFLSTGGIPLDMAEPGMDIGERWILRRLDP